MRADLDALTSETVELLQQLIRNRCVNDQTPEGAQEVTSARLLRDELDGLALDMELLEHVPCRTSLVARYPGTDPDAPAVNPEGWRRDPFGGELVTSADGLTEVWGRGAVDMLNLTSSMLVAFRELVRSGARYPGDIVYFAVADEEAGGVLGAKPIIDDHWDAVRCGYVLTEYGGMPSHGPDGTTVLLTSGEKTGAARRLTVHGTPGHGSMPYATDNALVKAAEIVRRLSEAELAPHIDEMFEDRVRALNLAPDLEAGLLDPARIADTLARLPPDLARNVHSCCHTTISANVMVTDRKANTVPDRAELVLDIRILPGQTQDEIDRLLEEIIGPDLLGSVDSRNLLPFVSDARPCSSTDTPMWDALTDAIHMAYPGARVVPSLVTGGTDARFFRDRGVPAYGAGLLSDRLPFAEFLSRFHGHNERIDLDSLRLTTQLWFDVLDRLWR